MHEELKVKELKEEAARGRKALEGVRVAALVSPSSYHVREEAVLIYVARRQKVANADGQGTSTTHEDKQ